MSQLSESFERSSATASCGSAASWPSSANTCRRPRGHVGAWILATTLLLGGTPAFAESFDSRADIRRASDWIGGRVMTTDGQELGRVEDLAMHRDTGELAYIVVSVGSFLIEHSLIAVEPNALQVLSDGRIMLTADPAELRDARRFANDQWPLVADISAPGGTEPVAPGPQESSAEPPPPAPPPTGTATISSDRRTAVLSAGEKTINEVEAPTPIVVPELAEAAPLHSPRPEGMPETKFDRLDKDGNGLLNRTEIASEITYRDSYSELDLDSNGVIDRAEFFPLED